MTTRRGLLAQLAAAALLLPVRGPASALARRALVPGFRPAVASWAYVVRFVVEGDGATILEHLEPLVGEVRR